MLDDTTLLLGPYVGNFEQETITFRPWARWISSVIQHKEVYVSTHSNRTFLYQWVPKENIFPIFGEFSRNELSQEGYIFDGLNNKDYSLLVRRFKERIQQTRKRKLEIFSLNYTKNTNNNYPIHNKLFEKMVVPEDIKIKEIYKNKIVFIPDIKEDLLKTDEIYQKLSSIYKSDLIVVGDIKTYLNQENVVLRCADYFENGYKYIISIIDNARMVICPTGHWSVIANIQRKPLFILGKSDWFI